MKLEQMSEEFIEGARANARQAKEEGLESDSMSICVLRGALDLMVQRLSESRGISPTSVIEEAVCRYYEEVCGE